MEYNKIMDKTFYSKLQETVSYCKAYLVAHDQEDKGTCTIGAGIYLYIILKGKRLPTKVCLITAPYQGNISNKQALKKALEYLQRNLDSNCFYDDGTMD